jgi:hypothetical protein
MTCCRRSEQLRLMRTVRCLGHPKTVPTQAAIASTLDRTPSTIRTQSMLTIERGMAVSLRPYQGRSSARNWWRITPARDRMLQRVQSSAYDGFVCGGWCLAILDPWQIISETLVHLALSRRHHCNYPTPSGGFLQRLVVSKTQGRVQKESVAYNRRGAVIAHGILPR